MKKYRIFRIIAIVLMVFCPLALMGNGQPETMMQGEAELVVMHTNDFHGHPLKFYNFPAPNVGGLPAIATLVQETRGMHERVLVLDAGDLNTGRPESNFFDAEPDIIGYNYIGYDAMVLGNHEFDNTLDILADQQQLANFPFLSANVKNADGSLVGIPYVIKEFDNLRVGIFGLTTSRTPSVTLPTITGNLIFEDEVIAARRIVAMLKPQVDIIIALTHLGLYDDNKSGSRRVAAQVEGIDLIVDGHSHSNIEEAVIEKGTPIVQAWQWGLKVGKAIINITDGKVSNFQWEAIPINLKNRERDADGKDVYTFIGKEIKEDAELLAQLTPYDDLVEDKLSAVIGTATALFEDENIRRSETALGNLVADAMLWATQTQGTDFAMQNGGGVRADIPVGPITKKLIYEVLPFDNSVMTVEMTGADVQAMFDFISTLSLGSGAFPQVSKGVSFIADVGKDEARDVLINGRPIDLSRTYKVATNSFMAVGGDNYTMMASGFRYDTSQFQRDAIIDYIQFLGGTISPKTENRITVIE